LPVGSPPVFAPPLPPSVPTIELGRVPTRGRLITAL
jgi:hypothetical protein